MQRRTFFTTFEISQICGVNPTTVQNWIKGKKLKAFQTPGGHRRVRREDLIAFLKKFGMPIPAEFNQGPPLIMIVDDEKYILDMLEDLMKSGDDDVNIASLLERICAKEGHTVFRALSGQGGHSHPK